MPISKHYNPKDTEAKWSRFWEQKKIFQFNLRNKGKIYSIDTPPPTVSGKMHIGHAYSYTHFDFIARYHRMKGENVFFPFGTDDNGLPTERLVEKLCNVRSTRMERKEFIKLCNQTLKKIRPDFIQDWKNVGMSCDFSKIYSTIDDNCRRISQKMFIDLYKKGKVFRQEAPVIWCPHCQTAIAQAELEDQEQKTFFNDLKFELENGKSLIISTTRPELLGSCVAVFVHPKDKRYRKLVGKKVKVPIFNNWVEIKADSAVEMGKGTGAVMCCTFGDKADVEWFKKYHLPLAMSVDKSGRMTSKANNYAELTIVEARKKIIEDLKRQDLLVNQKPVSHTVNIHDRCKTSVEILNSAQWYVSILKEKKKFLARGKQMRWYPVFMRSRYENWVKNLSWDWAISRQRFFGVPFPLWYCEKCGEVILANEKDLPLDPISTKPKTKCKQCGSQKFIPEKDVMDTWATSSLSPLLGLQLYYPESQFGKSIPFALRPQAHDIISTWLFYSVVRANYHFNRIPWKNVMISGHVLDKRGQKMSKSLGNVVQPQAILEKYGADALRFWTAGRSLGQDINYSEEDIRAGVKLLTKLWNVTRFVSMNCPKKVRKPKKLYPTDQMYIAAAQNLINFVTDKLNVYEFGLSKIEIEKFFWKFTDHYLELIKGRLYGENKENKNSAQYTIVYLLELICLLLAPYLPFISEEIYQTFFRKIYRKEISIHVCSFPKTNKKFIKNALLIPGTFFDFTTSEVIRLVEQIRSKKSQNNIKLSDTIMLAEIAGNKKLIKELKKCELDLKNVGRIKKIVWKTMNIKEVDGLEINFKLISDK